MFQYITNKELVKISKANFIEQIMMVLGLLNNTDHQSKDQTAMISMVIFFAVFFNGGD